MSERVAERLAELVDWDQWSLLVETRYGAKIALTPEHAAKLLIPPKGFGLADETWDLSLRWIKR